MLTHELYVLCFCFFTRQCAPRCTISAQQRDANVLRLRLRSAGSCSLPAHQPGLRFRPSCRRLRPHRHRVRTCRQGLRLSFRRRQRFRRCVCQCNCHRVQKWTRWGSGLKTGPFWRRVWHPSPTTSALAFRGRRSVASPGRSRAPAWTVRVGAVPRTRTRKIRLSKSGSKWKIAIICGVRASFTFELGAEFVDESHSHNLCLFATFVYRYRDQISTE